MIQLKRILVVLAGLMLSTPALAQPSQPSGIETAVLVLDASGSMSDSVGEESKIQVAQRAVGELIGKWDADVPLGLTVYGGKTGSCNDIRTEIPVGPVDASAFMSAVNALTPLGPTPLTDAVIAAAEQLDYEHNQATVILVSDGLETCSADPCEMATALEQKGIDLTVHVVGFGVDPSEATTLSCIAKNTGGQYKSADDAASLSQALTGIVQEVEKDKQEWRGKCGNHWGKNGRWTKGRWTHGKGKFPHRNYWEQLRKKWRKNKSLKRNEKSYGRFKGRKPGHVPGKKPGKVGPRKPGRGKVAPQPGQKPGDGKVGPRPGKKPAVGKRPPKKPTRPDKRLPIKDKETDDEESRIQKPGGPPGGRKIVRER
jgi:hypothetical protein